MCQNLVGLVGRRARFVPSPDAQERAVLPCGSDYSGAMKVARVADLYRTELAHERDQQGDSHPSRCMRSSVTPPFDV